jgi:5-methylthioadenosine/S-adenosylhomocysteine deaminase
VYGYGYPVFADAARNPADVRRVRAEHLPDDSALVTMALAPLGPSYAPIDVVAEDWRLARDLGLPIAVHVGSGPVARRPVTTLKEHGLLGPATLYVHGNSLPDEELDLIAATGGSMSIAPAVEALMGHGAPMIGRLRTAGITTGLGVDTVTAVAGDMFSLMRAALLSSQLGGGPRLTAADVLRMSTLDGAVALGLGDRIGSLRPGKQADIVLLRLAAQHDPVGTVVSAAHPGNVETVFVAGRVVRSGATPARYTMSETVLGGAPGG